LSDAAGGPALAGVLETCLYHDAGQTTAMERFYTEVLGLPLVSRWPGGVALRAGAGVLLLFEREALAARDSPLSAHGTEGPGHACLVVGDDGEYERRKRLLADADVEITHEESWDRGLRSFYFTDPAGNLLEIAAGDIWPA
jgi:catechol 2,3-dioxygenase-like lactoylglutathione lyase family enzyme